MSANNIVFIKVFIEDHKPYWEVYCQGCADNDDLESLKRRFETLEQACEYAEKLCKEYQVKDNIRIIS